MSVALSTLDQIRQLLMGPLLIVVVILIIWFVMIKPILALMPFVLLVALLYLLVR